MKTVMRRPGFMISVKAMAHPSNNATCQCGKTIVELAGSPILSATCYCRSCRTAGHQFEHDLGAPPTVNATGGVDYSSYRKDRIRIAQGAENLREYRLRPDSSTRRVVAKCCHSPMFTDFTPGHWLSIFRGRVPGAPASQMLLMTKDKEAGMKLPAGIPAYNTMPPGFMIKLIASWAAMGFRRPKITW
jgi:hypothetical protein